MTQPLSVIVSNHRDVAEAARLALRTAGPASGLYGPAAADMDRKLTELRDWLGRVAEQQRTKEARG